MIVDKETGTSANSAISQSTKGKEFEISGRDFAASLSGVQGLVGYTFRF
jgi:hypothetical protein